MPFKTPLNSTLTEAQQQALSKLNSLNTYVTAPKRPFQNLKQSQQISTFDLSTKFLNSVAGPGVADAVLQQFLRKIFATYGEDQFLLEDIIIKALAKALDARGIFLAPQLPSGETASNLTGKTATATTEVVEYEFVGVDREEEETTIKKAVHYTYTVEPIPPDLEVPFKYRPGVTVPYVYGKILRFRNNIPELPNLYYFRRNDFTDEQIIAKAKEETETVGFTASNNGKFYPPEGTVVETKGKTPGGKFVKLTSNIPEKLPETFIGKFSGDTGMTLDEIVREVKIEVSKYGYYDEVTKVDYPPAGTAKDEVESIRGGIAGYVTGGDIESEDGKFLPNALIEVIGAKPPLTVLTDETGYYSIRGLQARKYILKASLQNYTSRVLDTEVSSKQGDITNLDFPLTFTGDTSATTNTPVTGTTTGATVSDGSNYNTAQTNSEITNVTGGTDNVINVKYDYSVVTEPLEYEFLSQNLPPNAPNQNFTSILLTVTNNKGLPPATITIGPVDGETFKDYTDLVEEKNVWQDNFNNAQPVFVNGVEYPGRSEFLYKFSVTNNANLPTYEFALNNPLAEEILNQSLGTERIVNDVLYPPQGAQFIVPENDVDSSTFLPATGVTGSTTVVTDAVTRFVGNVEANIVIDEDILAAGLSGIGQDLRSTLASSFSFRINPEDIGLSNEEYLTKYLRPVLTAGKRALVAQIIKMIFGPKEIMSEDPQTQEKLLNSASCGEKMFTVSNNPSVTEKELEFNRVELKRQLESGKIELTVSCQKVEIQLPQNFEEEFDLLPSVDTGVPENQRPNPAESFVLLGDYVQSEMQRQRNEEDAAAIRRSFFEVLMDKIMQYISVAFSVSPEINQVFGILNAELTKTGQESISPQELLSSPCQITDACKSGNKQDFEEKSSFARSIINSLYSLVLSMLIRRLVAEAKLKIARLIKEKAKEKILKLVRRQKERTKFLSKLDNFASNAQEKVSKAQEEVQQFKESGLKDIFSFLDKKKSEDGTSDGGDTLD